VFNRLRLLLVAATGAAALTPAVRAQILSPLTIEGDAGRGESLAFTCIGCHGVDSAVNAYPTYHVPKLGGQNGDYIEVALQGYRAGTRTHATMQAQAAGLSDQDIADIAAYFVALEDEPATGISSADGETIRLGEQNATTCQSCHGTDGRSLSPQWPNLGGQHASYLLEAMKQYQRADRQDPVMGPLVSQLDEQTLEQLASFYAAQAGLYQPGR
jgi:cytochrome c553